MEKMSEDTEGTSCSERRRAMRGPAQLAIRSALRATLMAQFRGPKSFLTLTITRNQKRIGAKVPEKQKKGENEGY
jgi:hypothetical protein